MPGTATGPRSPAVTVAVSVLLVASPPGLILPSLTSFSVPAPSALPQGFRGQQQHAQPRSRQCENYL